MAQVSTLSSVVGMRVYSMTYDPASVPTITNTELTATVTGVLAGDYLIAVIPPASTTLTVGAGYVSAADTVKIMTVNPTAGALDAPSGTWLFVVATPQ